MTPDSTLRMPVLLVDTISGTNHFAVDLAHAIAGVADATVVTVDNSGIANRAGLRVLRVLPGYDPRVSKRHKIFQYTRALIVLAAEVWRHRRGIVHVQFFRFTLPELLLYAILKPCGYKLLFTAHNVWPHERRWWHGAAYALWYRYVVDHVHVLSGTAESGIAREFGVGKKSITRIPHGNYSSFRRRFPAIGTAKARHELGLPEGSVLLLFFGLVRPYKGVDRAVRALAHLGRSSDVVLVVVGGCRPEVEEDLRALSLQEGVSNRVIVRPRSVSDAELSMYLEAADIVVLPYRRIAQSGAMLMALTYGKPIVASRLEGFREIIADGATGVLLDTSNGAAFGEAIERLAQRPELRRRLGEAGARLAEERFSWEGIALELSALYSSLMGHSVGPGKTRRQGG